MSRKQTTGTWGAIGTLIVAMSAVQLAGGLLGTLVSLRVVLEGFGLRVSGLVLSAYYVGYTAGAFYCGRIIGRVGHIRAFAAFAGAVAASVAVQPAWIGAAPWWLFRAVTGFGIAGLFVTTESWLNAKVTETNRGAVFSIYMVGLFAALAGGQLLLNAADVAGFHLFALAAALISVAVVMVSTTHAEPPTLTPAPRLRFGELTLTAPVAVAGCAASGIASGAFYSLVPAWAQGEGIPVARISLFMTVAILGGLAFQVPVGRLSDRFDRRFVAAALGLGLAAACILMTQPTEGSVGLFLHAAVLGGFLSTLYPVSVAHANDRMPADRAVDVSARLILVSGVSSIFGPVIAGQIMGTIGIDGVLYFMAGAGLLFAAVAVVRALRVAEPPHRARSVEVLTDQGAQTLAHAPDEADPAAPSEAETFDAST